MGQTYPIHLSKSSPITSSWTRRLRNQVPQPRSPFTDMRASTRRACKYNRSIDRCCLTRYGHDGERALFSGVGSKSQGRYRLLRLESVQQVLLGIVQANVAVRQGYQEASGRPCASVSGLSSSNIQTTTMMMMTTPHIIFVVCAWTKSSFENFENKTANNTPRAQSTRRPPLSTGRARVSLVGLLVLIFTLGLVLAGSTTPGLHHFQLDHEGRHLEREIPPPFEVVGMEVVVHSCGVNLPSGAMEHVRG